jgi:ATP-dependent RNA helicase RhlE
MSEQSFADLGVSKAVFDVLKTSGITAPFQIQQQVIQDVLAGRDVLARSPTGSGKTLAFGIPVVDRTSAEARRPAALVLAPTRELATQIVDEIRPIAHARALRVTAVYGGVGLLKQAQAAARAHIIVATPGRLEDQLARRAFNLDNVRTLVIDEADRMLDMGFRPALDRIVELCPADRQTLFFSATLDGEAGRAARRYTNNASFHENGATDLRPSAAVEHNFIETTHEGRIDSLLEHLNGERDLALVFVRTKHGADKLVKKLGNEGVRAVAMHGNKTQRQRERALADFEAFQVDTLVATDVAARGIDVSGISHVINFDPPHDSETYVHRIGRTGRAGATGIGITLVSPDQRRDMARMANELGIEHGLAGGPNVGAGGFKRAAIKTSSSGGSQGASRPRRERSSDSRGERDGGYRGAERSENGGAYRGNDRNGSSHPGKRGGSSYSGGRSAVSRSGKPAGDAPAGRHSDSRPARSSDAPAGRHSDSRPSKSGSGSYAGKSAGGSYAGKSGDSSSGGRSGDSRPSKSGSGSYSGKSGGYSSKPSGSRSGKPSRSRNDG